jgi:uncharacterized membrane protein YjjP (DUF1212 family)
MALVGNSAELARPRERARPEWDEAATTIGWGLVILLVGADALPDGPVKYAAVAAVGALMLGLDATIVVRRRELDLFSAALGATALIAGAAALTGARVAAFALFFLLLGSALVLVPAVRFVLGRRRPIG